MGLSRRAYAALRGVRFRVVRKAITSGRIMLEADGTIDADKADAMSEAPRDPGNRRASGVKHMRRGTSAT